MMRKYRILTTLAAATVAALAACGGASTVSSLENADPANGQVLYELGPEGVYEPFCANCHRRERFRARFLPP